MRISDWSSDVCSSDLTYAKRPARGVLRMWRREVIWCVPLRVRQIGRIADLHGAAARRARHMDVPSASHGRTSTIAILVESHARVALFLASALLYGVRSEERTVVKECMSPLRARGS